MKKPKRTFLNSLNTYNRYYKSSGLYSFVFSNLLKVLGVIILVVLVALIIDTYIISVREIPEFLINNFSLFFILIVFFISESVLGMIPPDIFILWVSEFDKFWLMVGLLGIISYFGSISAYFIGRLIRLAPQLKLKTENYYSEHLDKIKKWGGIFIVIAALLPIPYAIACSLSGIIKFPFKNLIWLGFFRIVRFFLYALLIYFGLVV